LLLLLLCISLKYHAVTDLHFAIQVCHAGHATKKAASLTSCAKIAATALCAPTVNEAGSTGLQQHAARLDVITATHCSRFQCTILFITQLKQSSQVRYHNRVVPAIRNVQQYCSLGDIATASSRLHTQWLCCGRVSALVVLGTVHSGHLCGCMLPGQSLQGETRSVMSLAALLTILSSMHGSLVSCCSVAAHVIPISLQRRRTLPHRIHS